MAFNGLHFPECLKVTDQPHKGNLKAHAFNLIKFADRNVLILWNYWNCCSKSCEVFKTSQY